MMIILFTFITFANLIGFSVHYPISNSSFSCESDYENKTVNWVLQNGRCYYFSDQMYSYDKASEYCRGLSNQSYLVVPSNELVLAFLQESQFDKNYVGVKIVSNNLVSESNDEINADIFGKFINSDSLENSDIIINGVPVVNQPIDSCLIFEINTGLRTYSCQDSLYFICEKEAKSVERLDEAEEGNGGLTTTEIVLIVVGGLLYFGIPIVVIGINFNKYFLPPLKKGGCLRVWIIFQIIIIVLFSVGLALALAAILLVLGLLFGVCAVILLCCDHFVCESGKIGEETTKTTEYRGGVKVNEYTTKSNIYSEFMCCDAFGEGCKCYAPLFSLIVGLVGAFLELFFSCNTVEPEVEEASERPPEQPIYTISN